MRSLVHDNFFSASCDYQDASYDAEEFLKSAGKKAPKNFDTALHWTDQPETCVITELDDKDADHYP